MTFEQELRLENRLRQEREYNAILKRKINGEIATSETFTDYLQARKYYDGIGNDIMKVISIVNRYGIVIREIERNFKQ